MSNPVIGNLGDAQDLRPSGSGWGCVFSQIVEQADSNQNCYAERQGFSIFEAGGNTWPWASQLSPQNIADGLRSQGHTVFYIEIWENPGGLVGFDQFVYISVYG